MKPAIIPAVRTPMKPLGSSRAKKTGIAYWLLSGLPPSAGKNAILRMSSPMMNASAAAPQVTGMTIRERKVIDDH